MIAARVGYATQETHGQTAACISRRSDDFTAPLRNSPSLRESVHDCVHRGRAERLFANGSDADGDRKLQPFWVAINQFS